jgi:hypothetical protein
VSFALAARQAPRVLLRPAERQSECLLPPLRSRYTERVNTHHYGIAVQMPTRPCRVRSSVLSHTSLSGFEWQIRDQAGCLRISQLLSFRLTLKRAAHARMGESISQTSAKFLSYRGVANFSKSAEPCNANSWLNLTASLPSAAWRVMPVRKWHA